MNRAIGLNFHGIGTPTRALEPGEAPYWLSTGQFTRLLDRIAAAPKPHDYVLTFDDGNISDHDIALPALAAHGLRARFFILTNRIGLPGSLDTDHLQALQAAGMTIGSHGTNHVAWPELDDAALSAELAGSRMKLEDICNQPVTEAGIPFGHYDARVLRALRGAGYAAAFSSDGGTMDCEAFLRPRTSLRSDMTPAQITSLLTAHTAPLRRLRRTLGMAKRRWLPLA